MRYRLIKLLFMLLLVNPASARQTKGANDKRPLAVLAYYSGDAAEIDQYNVQQLTHIIYSFCHLKDNKLFIGNGEPIIRKLVSLKKQHPTLKILLSLGGWGGCNLCSDVFASAEGRTAFAQSVKEWTDKLGTDGIDLDWEYPAIEGYPGHRYTPEDKHNFTLLLQQLKKYLGNRYEISFAAGGFTTYLQQSIEWLDIIPLVDKVNLMTYDLINGYSTTSGHHTPLYSTPNQLESVDHAVHYLDSIGFPKNKLVIGAAFYARIFDVDTGANNGLYQSGKFNHAVGYNEMNNASLAKAGFVYFWDDTAKAPYMYSAVKKQLLTYDDEKSIMLKTKYAIDHHLNGIMFWELANDKSTNGLLDVIDKTIHR